MSSLTHFLMTWPDGNIEGLGKYPLLNKNFTCVTVLNYMFILIKKISFNEVDSQVNSVGHENC
jgi:hypothetical protein